MNASQNIAAKVQDGKGKIMKSTPTPFPKTDVAMLKWFTEKRNNNIAIDSRLFKVQAMKFAKDLGEQGRIQDFVLGGVRETNLRQFNCLH